MAARTWMASLPQTQSGLVNLDGYRMQLCELMLASMSIRSKAVPAFTILQEEVSMSSSCLTQGLLIAENAG